MLRIASMLHQLCLMVYHYHGSVPCYTWGILYRRITLWTLIARSNVDNSLESLIPSRKNSISLVLISRLDFSPFMEQVFMEVLFGICSLHQHIGSTPAGTGPYDKYSGFLGTLIASISNRYLTVFTRKSCYVLDLPSFIQLSSPVKNRQFVS